MKNLIVRVMEGRVHSGQIYIFREQAQKAVRDARRHDGLVYAHVGRQAHADGGEQIVFISVWRDLEALYGWLGGTDLLGTPVLNPGDREVFEHFEVQHYEVVEPAETEPSLTPAAPRAAAV
ncbi:MAG: antibiotic biosynthesis monooxygenase [Candidatus Limnocylindrales bacterium]